jgi:putative Ca2+/H+ antiporter (TMEM165/GDT1 family)
MIQDIFAPLLAVGLAELGDKTQISVLLLSCKTQKRLKLLLGVMLAFLVVDGIAIVLGSWVTNAVPKHYVKIAASALFIICGALMLMSKEEKEGEKTCKENAFASGFLLIFLAEWGDKTQIASALFATKYHIVGVLIGTMVALAILSVMAIYLGRFVACRVKGTVIKKIAGVVFIAMGAIFLFSK